ncbi:aminotransferase class V-fold PLP-dependent enzyme, partial [Mycobacterium tuberculosis]|nr:aminotransferase class V-fold PLP-dependent enzyme [Mycobacterium tuberculosis]
EHPSVIETMKQLEKDGFEVTYLPVDGDGRISLDDLQVAIKEETILVSVMHVNNEIGTIKPIKAIGTLLKEYPKVFFHVDAVQSVGKVPLELYKFGIDACTMSSHKFHGLK